MDRHPESEPWDTIVVGAGIAGLAAARTLAEAGLRVLLLEAQDHVGGRIRTVREASETIELGAEFIHGRPPQLWDLIEEASLETYERTGDFLRLEGGSLVAEAWSEEPDEASHSEHAFDPLEALKDYSGPDQSFADYVDRLDLSQSARAEALGYVEGFNAADATQASILALGRQQRAEDAIEGERVWRIRDGYDRLPEFVADRFRAADGRLLLNAPVDAILWEPGRVRVQTGAGEFAAATAVVTVPLGVLQAGRIRFDPAPGSILQHAANLRMGQVCRFTLRFARRLWPERMSFLLARELQPSVWWTAHPTESLTLTGWTGGPRADELLALPHDQLRLRACAALGQALHLPPEEVEAELHSMQTCDWRADPCFLGAYSWIPVGALEAPGNMAEPIEETLFFAGEHTDTTGHWGTVHAALGSGLRAARQAENAVAVRRRKMSR